MPFLQTFPRVFFFFLVEKVRKVYFSFARFIDLYTNYVFFLKLNCSRYVCIYIYRLSYNTFSALAQNILVIIYKFTRTRANARTRYYKIFSCVANKSFLGCSTYKYACTIKLLLSYNTRLPAAFVTNSNY